MGRTIISIPESETDPHYSKPQLTGWKRFDYQMQHADTGTVTETLEILFFYIQLINIY